MSIFNYVLITIIIILLAVLFFGILYVLYTRKINRVLKKQEKAGNYGSLDRKFFTVIIGCLVVLLGLFAFSYEKVYKYEIPFYENIADFDVEKFGTDLLNIIKPENGHISLDESMVIITDPDGRIKDASINLIIKKGGKYFLFNGVFNDEKNTITYKKTIITIYEGIFGSYIPLTEYIEVFSRIDFENIWEMADVEKPNYFDLEFEMALENGSFNPNISGPIKMINPNGDVEDYANQINGLLGHLTISKIREYLDGSFSVFPLEHFLLIP
jgi:hypothetical protein